MKRVEIFLKFSSFLFYLVFSSNAFALGVGSTKDFLAIGVHQLSAQKEADLILLIMERIMKMLSLV